MIITEGVRNDFGPFTSQLWVVFGSWIAFYLGKHLVPVSLVFYAFQKLKNIQRQIKQKHIDRDLVNLGLRKILWT